MDRQPDHCENCGESNKDGVYYAGTVTIDAKVCRLYLCKSCRSYLAASDVMVLQTKEILQ